MVLPQNTPKWPFLVGKPMIVGYHYFRKPPHVFRFLNDVLRRISPDRSSHANIPQPQDEVHRDPAQGLPHWSTEAVPGPIKLGPMRHPPAYKIFLSLQGFSQCRENMSRLWQHWTDHTKRWSKTSTPSHWMHKKNRATSWKIGKWNCHWFHSDDQVVLPCSRTSCTKSMSKSAGNRAPTF